jgi:uncharacterized protein (TIGR03792 family)
VLSLLLVGLLVMVVVPGQVLAADATDQPAVEVLRLQVPRQQREVWLRAERLTWEPWLRRQPGFLRRDVLWDPESEEGVLLIHWASRGQWKQIPDDDVARVQDNFERQARRFLAAMEPPQGGDGRDGPVGTARLRTDLGTNPFPLLSARELQPMDRITAESGMGHAGGSLLQHH